MKRFLVIFMILLFLIVSCSDNKKDVVADVDETTDKIIDEDVGAQDFAPVDEDEVVDTVLDEDSVVDADETVDIIVDEDETVDTIADEDETVDTIADTDETVDEDIDEDVGAQDFAPVDEDEQVDEDTYVYPCSVTQCFIDEVCINDKTTDVVNICQECDIVKDLFSWSFKSSEFVCGTTVGDCDVAAKCLGDSAVCPANSDSDLLCESLEHKVCITSNCVCDTEDGYHAGTDGACCIDECEIVGISCEDGVLSECSEENGCKIKTDSDCASGSCQDSSTCEPDCTENDTQVITCATEPTEFQKQTCNVLEVWEDDGACYSVSTGSMVSIPGNSFWQGCRTTVNGSTADTNCYSQESPYHQVTVPSFQMDVYEVTNAQYIQFLNAQGNVCFANECVDSDDADLKLSESGGVWSVDGGLENFPLVEVTWYGAKAYCEWAGKRLPSESEWELAARGTDERLYPWGDETATCDYAVMDNGTDGCGTNLYWAVGSKPSGISPYGLFDMAGNVWEWVEDDYHSNYSVAGRPDDGSAWIDSPRGSSRVLRGGSWNYGNRYLRASSRSRSAPLRSNAYNGFRCASE